MTTAHPAPLRPRSTQLDLFVCDIADVMLKDDMATMEHPVFSLSTKRDLAIRRYRRGDVSVHVLPSGIGMATIHDKDIIIYCISQLIAAIRDGREVSRTVEIRAYDLLSATGRDTAGVGYSRLRDALRRLVGTRVETTVVTGGIVEDESFGLLDAWRVQRETVSGRMISLEVTLSEWLYRAVLASEVLTLSPDYFRLRKPLERRLYELCRKHCGGQSRWQIGLDLLRQKCGSVSALRRFREHVRKVIGDDHLPDYTLSLCDDVLTCRPRREASAISAHRGPIIRPGTYDLARKAAPGYDVYALEADWRSWWIKSGEPALRSPDGAFIGFCRARFRSAPDP